ncbi:helix-turn-helix domain-containing protein [Pseudomonas sp. ANT_H12B]|uniref:winged helix-turn-helix transcriptional regulator n=1 Tax=Pseudomonas sp. ANT_H12B TaxID=2597348 RepID=UPI0011EEC27E|nr:winged helix-turn-helix transcriptional regulator [Pseudomonas sp. ANT_H12B]KAA0975402.1 winged helix-turn-helix transcriptional regulator [Pseudomonas sp. ANT_H12B]
MDFSDLPLDACHFTFHCFSRYRSIAIRHVKLRQLANDGLIERVDFGELPRRVEYQLSEMGDSGHVRQCVVL